MYGIRKVRKSVQLAVAVAICVVVLGRVFCLFLSFFKCSWGWGIRVRQAFLDLGPFRDFCFLRILLWSCQMEFMIHKD